LRPNQTFEKTEGEGMSFNPESVPIFYKDKDALSGVTLMPDGYYVRHSDYTQLLALYRQEVPECWNDWIPDLDAISTRTFNILRLAEVSREKFLKMNVRDLLRLRNCGMKTVIEICEWAKENDMPVRWSKGVWCGTLKQKKRLREITVGGQNDEIG